MDSTTTRPTWAMLCELEPRLLLLERELLAADPPGDDWCHAYEAGKQRLKPLVGWDRHDGHDVLSSSAAWECAIDRVLAIVEREATA